MVGMMHIRWLSPRIQVNGCECNTGRLVDQAMEKEQSQPRHSSSELAIA